MRQLRKKILAAFFSLFIFLLVLEIGIRITGKFATLSEKMGNGFLSFYTVTHPGFMDVHEPGKDIDISNSEFSYKHSIDRLGFRNKPCDTCTYPVLAIGDSFTEGLGAPQDSTWPQALAKILNTRVYNAGIMGSDPVYGVRLLEEDYFPFRPRQIIFAVNFSDVADVVIRGGQERFISYTGVHYRAEPWFIPIYRYSHLFRAVLHLALGYDYMFNSPSARQENIQIALGIMTDVLAQADGWCKAKGIKLKVFVHPVPQEYYMNLDRRLDFKQVDALVPMLDRRGVEAINLRKSFENRFPTPEDWKEVSWPIDGHFNSKGYEIMGDLIADEIRDSSTVY